MKRAILPISLGLMGLALTATLFWWAFSGQREDVAQARAFLTHIAEGDHSAARLLMTPELAAQMQVQGLASQFGEIEGWTRLAFPSRRSNSGGGSRRTEIWGTGSTESGCESDLNITIIGGLVDAYSVTPLCPTADVEA